MEKIAREWNEKSKEVSKRYHENQRIYRERRRFTPQEYFNKVVKTFLEEDRQNNDNRCVLDGSEDLAKDGISSSWDSFRCYIVSEQNEYNCADIILQCSGFVAFIELPCSEVDVLNKFLAIVQQYCPAHPNFTIAMIRNKKKKNSKKRHLFHIVRLEVFGKNIPYLPVNIGNIPYLKTLNLQKNHLSTLPASFDQLLNLQFVQIGFNDFTILPKIIGEMMARKPNFSVSLSSNPFRSLWGFPRQAINSISLFFASGSKWEYENACFNLTDMGKSLIEACGSRRLPYDPDYDEHGGWFRFNEEAATKVQAYYAKSPWDLALQYVHHREEINEEISLTNEEEVRLMHEADLPILNYLESKLSSYDVILKGIQQRLGAKLADTLGIRL